MRNQRSVDGKKLESRRLAILESIKSEIGPGQVAVGALGFAPDWILIEAIQLKLETNWSGAYTTVATA